jgi:hypothetical protein
MNFHNEDTVEPIGFYNTIGCIGFDTLNIPSDSDIIERRIARKLKIMVSIITRRCLEFRQFIVGIGKLSYESSGERGAVTIVIHEDDFDDTFRKIHTCYDIFKDPEHKDMDDMVKINLMGHAFPVIEYYALDSKHLKTEENVRAYHAYNVHKSSIILIRMASSSSDRIHNYISTVNIWVSPQL